MHAVITGDIVNSSSTSPKIWLPQLKEELARSGDSPRHWEIFRGDSFQILVEDPAQALASSIRLKAAVKMLKDLDVRMSIGIGDISHRSPQITESNGTAFIHSGEKFEMLKKEKINLAVKSDWPDFDRDINLFLRLALLTMDKWTPNAAEVVKMALDHPDAAQAELGNLIGIKQNAISSRLKRAAFDEIEEFIHVYQEKLNEQL